jgi:hypothetical protein
MADQKLPSYVEKIDSAGRRFFKQEFVDMLVSDIKTGRTTVTKAHQDFELSRSLIQRWMKGKGGGTPGGSKANITRRKHELENGKTSLLALAEKYDTRDAGSLPAEKWNVNHDHIKLAVAYCEGRISRAAANYALRRLGVGGGKTKLMTTVWLGTVLRWALSNGYSLKRG